MIHDAGEVAFENKRQASPNTRSVIRGSTAGQLSLSETKSWFSLRRTFLV